MNYQRIDIVINPALVTGTLVVKAICQCGIEALKETVLVGKRYICDVKSVRWARWRCEGCGKVQDVRLIDVYSDMPFVPISWFLLDLLDLGAGVPFAPKPTRWEDVRNGKVSPKRPAPRVEQYN